MGTGSREATGSESWNADGSRLRYQCLKEDMGEAEPGSLFKKVCCELKVEERGFFFM